jgi:hypothetical protein
LTLTQDSRKRANTLKNSNGNETPKTIDPTSARRYEFIAGAKKLAYVAPLVLGVIALTTSTPLKAQGPGPAQGLGPAPAPHPAPAPSAPSDVPEIDGNSAGTALAFLVGGLLVARGGRSKSKDEPEITEAETSPEK